MRPLGEDGEVQFGGLASQRANVCAVKGIVSTSKQWEKRQWLAAEGDAESGVAGVEISSEEQRLCGGGHETRLRERCVRRLQHAIWSRCQPRLKHRCVGALDDATQERTATIHDADSRSVQEKIIIESSGNLDS